MRPPRKTGVAPGAWPGRAAGGVQPRSPPPPEPRVRAPPYNLARLSFEWSAVVARESLSRSLWNTGSLAQLRQHPPPGPRTGTGGDAHGPIDARTDRGGADLLREHEVQPAVLGRD